MNLFWLQNKIIILFFLGLTGLTAFSFVQEEGLAKTKSLNEIIAETSEKKRSPDELFNERLPATVDAAASVSTTSLKKKSQDQLKVQIFCGPGNLKVNSAKYLVMLQLSSCLALQEKHQLWVKNETNGFKAQIFKVEAEKFKTDFIQLNKGMNKVLLEGVLKDGQKIVQTLEILSGS